MASEETKLAVRATLIASTIAGFFALAGSALGYIQAQESQESATAAKLAELRVDAYGRFADDVTTLRQKLGQFGDAAVKQGILIPMDQVVAVNAEYDGLADSEARARLIGPESVDDATIAVDDAVYYLKEALIYGESGSGRPLTWKRYIEMHEAGNDAFVRFYDVAQESIEIATE